MQLISVCALILVQGLVLVSSQRRWKDYRNVKPVSSAVVFTRALPVCLQPGLTCGSDCVSVYLCKDTGNGLRPVAAQTCKAGETCSAGKCSTVPSHECSSGAKYPFVCKSIDGVYPDPADCRKKHYCVPDGKGNLTNVDASCGEDYGYNPLTTYCDVKLVNQQCHNNLVPVCQNPAQTGTVPGNPSIYFICLPYSLGLDVLYPFLYICPHGKVYSGNYSCEDTPAP